MYNIDESTILIQNIGAFQFLRTSTNCTLFLAYASARASMARHLNEFESENRPGLNAEKSSRRCPLDFPSKL